MSTIIGRGITVGEKFDFSGANITKDDLEYGKYGWDANGNLITGWREGSVTLQPTSLTLDADNPNGTITVTRAGDGVISASSSDTSVATVSVNGTTVTVSSVNETDGSATVIVNVARGTEYEAASAACAVTAAFFPNPISGTVSAGSTVTFAGKSWIVQHVDGKYAYLASNGIVSTGAFSSSNSNVYANSDILKTTCANYETTLGSEAMSYCQSVTVNGGTSKVFIPSRVMYETDWDWPKASADNRVQSGGNNWYWTSTPSYGTDGVWYVTSSGGFYGYSSASGYAGGFRPAVKVQYKG